MAGKAVLVVKVCSTHLFVVMSSCRPSDEKHPDVCPDKIVDTLADAVDYILQLSQ